MRAVIYARYSSDLQREASIEDQVRLCREAAEGRGWTIVGEYADRAASGSSRFRPEYQRLLADAKAGKFDVVVAEALDRLSRDQEDVAALYKALIFADVALVTLAEGEISELHVGLKGTMNALFLRDLAAKTHRGLRGRVEQGRSAGGKAFGYQVAKEVDAEGDRVRGKRLIDADEAIIVRRIYSEFSTGSSPRAIATRLNQEGVAGPGGRPWQDTTIRGHGGRGTGILRNELYAGRLVWNRMRFIKDPATGKRVSRPNPSGEWIVEDVPELRIIDNALWESVSARLADIAASPTAQAIKAGRFWEKRRPKHVLTGLAVCGCCGHPLAAVGKDYLRCSRAHRNGLCTNTTGVKRGVLEEIVISALQHNLMAPDLVAEFIAAAAAWGLNPDKDATYLNYGGQHDPAKCYSATYKVPENDAFWSITLYGEDGYMKSENNILNSSTAKLNGDGTFTAYFGSKDLCGDVPNRLDVTPGWNFLMRIYRPGPSVLQGNYALPEVTALK